MNLKELCVHSRDSPENKMERSILKTKWNRLDMTFPVTGRGVYCLTKIGLTQKKEIRHPIKNSSNQTERQ